MKHVELIPSKKTHVCQSQHVGNYVRFTCQLCNYIRTYSIETGDFSTTGGEVGVLHEGMHYGTGIDANQNMN